MEYMLDSPITRRMLVAGAAGGTLALTNHSASAQRCVTSPRAKGSPVWLDMDQQELDDAYNQAVFAFNQQNIADRVRKANALALTKIGAPDAIAYGSAPVEKVDLFRTKRPNAPTLIYIHGGAWRDSIFNSTAFQAEMFINAGANYAAIGFSNVDNVGGDLFVLANQCQRAVEFIYRNARRLELNADRIYLAGHSSGAHLASCVLISDRMNATLPPDLIKGALLASGMYDLKPVRLSARSAYVRFTDAMEQELSAQRYVARIRAPLTLAYGTLETPEFQRQTLDFAAVLRMAGKSVSLLEGDGHNHFEVAETLGNPYGFIGRPAMEMMGLAA